MSVTDWSDYHAWHVTPDAMQAARLVLSDAAYAALFKAAALGDGVYLVPREAIEDAALAMPGLVGVQFLMDVYQLSRVDGMRTMSAIHAVRHL